MIKWWICPTCDGDYTAYWYYITPEEYKEKTGEEWEGEEE